MIVSFNFISIPQLVLSKIITFRYILLQVTNGGINGHHRGGGNSDACEKHDPCQHGGICISTDDGPKCQCRDKNFEGAYCEIGKCTYLLLSSKLNF